MQSLDWSSFFLRFICLQYVKKKITLESFRFDQECEKIDIRVIKFKWVRGGVATLSMYL